MLLIKLSNPNIGLSETAAVYLGHTIILYFNMKGNDFEDEDWLIINHLLQRIFG